MKNKIFLPGQLVSRKGEYSIGTADSKSGVLPGIYLVLGIVDSCIDVKTFIEYAEWNDRDRHSVLQNFQYRMISPSGNIVCFNVPYMHIRYKVVS